MTCRKLTNIAMHIKWNRKEYHKMSENRTMEDFMLRSGRTIYKKIQRRQNQSRCGFWKPSL